MWALASIPGFCSDRRAATPGLQQGPVTVCWLRANRTVECRYTGAPVPLHKTTQADLVL